MVGKEELKMGKLTARQVETLKEVGRHSDGDNLYLNIAKGGSKSWVLFYRFGDKRKEMGLGGAGDITLAEARKRALIATRLLCDSTKTLLPKSKLQSVPKKRKLHLAFLPTTILNSTSANSKTAAINNNGKRHWPTIAHRFVQFQLERLILRRC